MTRFSLGAYALLALASCAAAPVRQAVPAEPSGGEPSALRPPEQAAAPRASRKAMVRRILPHNVRVSVVESGNVRRTASGVVIGVERTPAGAVSYVLTNAHAVETEGVKEPRFVVIVESREKESQYAAEVVAHGSVPDMDLALVRVAGVALSPAQLAPDAELELGEDVVVAASPYGRALSLSGGMVSQVEWDPKSREPRMLKTDAAIGYGASGGGIFSLETGRLLAIVEGYRTAKVAFSMANQDYSFDVPMPGETFAAPSAKVRRFLQTSGFLHLLTPAGKAPGAAQTARR